MNDRARQVLVYGAPLGVVGLVTLFILNPGILSPDSVDQWSQAIGLTHLHDWHPVLDTLWIRFWSFAGTPAVPIAVQTIAMAAAVGFAFALQRWFGVPARVLVLPAVLVAIWPPTVVFDATLWKDVPYSIAVLTATALLYQLWRSPALAENRSFQIGIAACVFAAAMFRHNGVVASVCLIVATLLLARSDRRRILIASAIALVCWVGLNKLVKRVEGVTPIPPGYVAIGYLASHVAAGTPLAPEESRLVDAIHPLAGGWPYVCGLTDPTVYDGRFTIQGLIDEGWAPVGLVAKLTLRNPWATFRHFVCASRFLWDPTAERLTGASLWIEKGEYRTIQDGAPLVEQPPMPSWRRWLLQLVLRTEQPGLLQLFWSPAPMFYLLVLAAGWVALRKREWAPLILFLPLVGQTIMMALIAPTPHARYQFAVILAAWIFVPGLVYLALQPRPSAVEAAA